MKNPVEVLVLEEYMIKFYDESDYKFDSSDNLNTYNSIYLNGEKRNLTTIIGIELIKDDIIVSNCLIGSEGGGTGINPNSTLISYGGVVVCCSNSIFKMTIPNLELEWKIQADSTTCFGIYYLDEDYIVHGEMEITRIDKSGQIVWQQSGRDIWTTLEGIDDFCVYDNYILVTDWNYYQYKFDYNGILLEEYKTEVKNDLVEEKITKSNLWWKFWK